MGQSDQTWEMGMRKIAPTMLIATLALAACTDRSSSNDTANVGNDSVVNEAGPETAPASSAEPQAAASADRPSLTRDFLVGSWAEEDCANPDVRLNADGSTEGGTWALRGSQMVRTTPEGDDPPLDVEVVDADHFRVSFAGLPPQTMKRCP